MTVNRQVGYLVDSSVVNSLMSGFGPSFAAGTVITKVRVTCKLSFAPATYTDTAVIETGVWGAAIQVGLGGVVPDTWHVTATDPSILAYDSSDPDATARVFWAPDTDTAYVQSSITRTVEFQGQYRPTAAAQMYITIIDVTGSANGFRPSYAWQIWHAS